MNIQCKNSFGKTLNSVRRTMNYHCFNEIPVQMKLFSVLSMLFICSFSVFSETRKSIDLSGIWEFSLDRNKQMGPASKMDDVITLPGTTDTNHKGDAITDKSVTTRLSRPFSYKGKAWYRKNVEIPADWQGKNVYLTLERTKPSEIYIDGVLAGTSNDISTPQEFDLSKYLTPGSHTIAIMIDNSSGVPEQVYGSSHAYTEDTQTNWNGIIGEISLSTEAFTPDPIKDINPAFKKFEIRGKHFYADGHPVFLRGRHDACVWPLTGHVAMDIESWRKYFDVCKRYGLNHVRFHSWCPPEAAFAAADEAGIYLQPELPFWGDFNDKDSTLMTFLHKEGVNIMKRYGHHPSFRMFALGNELRGNISKMTEFVEDFRKIAPDKIYTLSSNYYLGYQGMKPGMDFFVTCRIGGEGWGNYNTHTRGSFSFADAADGGMINHFYPNTKMNFDDGCGLSSVPVISHETAQFQSYPDFQEIDKYTGALYPYNMEIFRDRLSKAGMEDQMDDFHRASGQWALQLYKQDIEMDLRTADMAGFQLLDLQDYPGQGSAYVGILDAFLDSKGYCSEEEWRQWCSPVVPLMIADKFCYTTDETFNPIVKIANYSGESLNGKTLEWSLGEEKGSLTIPDGEGLIEAGEISLPLNGIKTPAALQFKLYIPGTEYHNTYDIWVYEPNVDLKALQKNIIITDSLTGDVMKKLTYGAKVLLMPGASKLTVGPLFQTDYWNYRMFKTIAENNKKAVSPGTLGLLTNPEHPLFNNFPTEIHTNWQWFPVVKNSNPFILDNTDKAYRPIVQVIDNIERNHKLGLVFEFAVGKGRLLCVMSDLNKAAEYPEGRQFFASVLKYMNSNNFRPAVSLSPEALSNLMTGNVEEIELEELNNISIY